MPSVEAGTMLRVLALCAVSSLALGDFDPCPEGRLRKAALGEACDGDGDCVGLGVVCRLPIPLPHPPLGTTDVGGGVEDDGCEEQPHRLQFHVHPAPVRLPRPLSENTGTE